jgi:hypothetical protein
MKELIGEIIENESERLRTARIHQGWWRAFVLGEKQGERPNSKEKKICNTVEVGGDFRGNFLTNEIADVVDEVLKQRSKDAPGLIQEDRLKKNLLSSQPLCFNFFGLFYNNKELATKVVKSFYPAVSEVKNVFFEYAPTPKQLFTDDNSAYDVAFEVVENDKIGLIGIECKYTESFSPQEYRTDRYKQIYIASNSFSESYDVLTSSKFNQLFRNQLIAESLLQNNKYSFVYTALFCAPEDKSARSIGDDFGKLLNMQFANFRVITYLDFIESLQREKITIQQREFSMLLWARYIGYQLSARAKNEFNSKG